MPNAVQFPNRVTSPPGGWRYKVPQSGQEFDGVNEPQLLEKLKAHYRANGWDFPANIKDLIEQQICAKQKDYCVEPHTGVPPLTPGQMAAVAYHLTLEGTRRLVGIGDKVTQEQANTRAATCAGCSENVPREGCSQCNANALRELIVRVVGNRGTPHDDRLGVCRGCLCELRAKIWITLPTLKKLTNPQQWAALPEHCWMKKEAA